MISIISTIFFKNLLPSVSRAFVSAILLGALTAPNVVADSRPASPASQGFVVHPDEQLGMPLPGQTAPPKLAYARAPLAFERNDGQTDAAVAFLGRGRGYTFYLTSEEAVLVLHEAKPRPGAELPATEEGKRQWLSNLDPGQDLAVSGLGELPAPVLRMRLAGAHSHPSAQGEEMLAAKANYFIGNQPSRWRTNIPTFGKVRCREVYPGIDLVYYGNEGQLEYDFTLAPGADPNRIALEFAGADQMRTDGGDLVLEVSDREVRWRQPIVYQEVNGVRHEVAGHYRLEQGAQRDGSGQALRFVTFELAAYDPTLPLVIDPRLVYSTYLGGTGNDWAGSVAADRDGNAYILGDTASLDFPKKGAVFSEASGDRDLFVAKFSPTGELLFSTYLGGSAKDDGGWGGTGDIAVSAQGECWIVGTTWSIDFPLVQALQEGHGGGEQDTYVAVLSGEGSALRFSTYWGGSENEQAYALALGESGDAYIAGRTASTDFPTKNAFQPELTANWSDPLKPADAFVMRMQADRKGVVYSTFNGRASSGELARGVAVDAAGNAFIALWVYTNNEVYSWALSKISPDGQKRLFESRLQDSRQMGMGVRPSVALAPNDMVIIAGDVNARNLPARNEPQTSVNWPAGHSDGYIAQYDSNTGTFLSGVYFGGNGQDAVARAFVDSAGDIVFVGWTAGQDFKASGFPMTDVVDPALNVGHTLDCFVTKFSSKDLSMLSSTVLGNSPEELR